MVVAGCGIGVFKGAISDSAIAALFSGSTTRTSVLSGSILFGAILTLWTNDPSWFKGINGKLVGWLASCSILLLGSSEAR